MESAITESIIDEAMRIAKYGFIIKERPFSSIFQLHPPDQWIGGKI
nr:hypothetical protein [Veillonella denticariosi]